MLRVRQVNRDLAVKSTLSINPIGLVNLGMLYQQNLSWLNLGSTPVNLRCHCERVGDIWQKRLPESVQNSLASMKSLSCPHLLLIHQ